MSSSQLARADITGPNGIHLEATTLVLSPADLKLSSDRPTPASAECTSNRDPPSRNSFGADSHSGSRISLPSIPAFQAQDGPAPGQSISGSAPGGVGTYGGFDTTRAKGPQSRALIHDPSRTSTFTPATAALPREQSTACGQMSKAVTLAQPIWAAAIATKPLPVQRSSTRRPATSAVSCIMSTSNRESSCG